jgi:hypothetical protein
MKCCVQSTFILYKSVSNKMHQLAVYILFHCRISLHVSGALCAHHQEYIKLHVQPLVQVVAHATGLPHHGT